MMIYTYIEQLINYGIKNSLIEEEDKIVVKNEIMNLLNLKDWIGPKEINFAIPEYPQDILNKICDWAVSEKIIENGIGDRDLFDTLLMGKMTPYPREVIAKFRNLAAEKIENATEDYYKFSKKTNYIRTDRIAKNLYWLSPTEYGDLEITINLSKPEKDPKEIEREKSMAKTNYPKCLLCYENIGFSGTLTHPARQNHRVIPLDLAGEKWYFQYSPYVYYNEHAIIFCSEHRDMKIDRAAFKRLADFITEFPHYFLGSNADLPIVGGSILSHDHYQGGRHEFPMAKAEVERKIEFKDYQEVEAGIVKWPMSVIRLKALDKNKLISLADKILSKWRDYSDEEVGVLAYSDDKPHNTITPISRRRGKYYEFDLVLRNNRTDESNLLGIFHPHAEYHNIKKENIGLIEVMGLAVLPGRLKDEMRKIAKYLKENLLDEIKNDKDTAKHYEWVSKFYKKYEKINNFSEENIIKNILNVEIGITFAKVLENAGVFKRNEQGQKAFLKFIDEVNR
ncbi:UDP-glucose--hexose-1-phosphate uridylyltransferase [Fusobacterium gastrosuis]|uniref:UDP-glucose--hexose-1-phosphate uridylyltransferase n=1 Tax=Fusobacterium gastrosuis TaxID=1755100 RepID=UPI002971C8B5|nr:UDP-glucose--hexose-1-phosphate uridylyltransferase [Fusobacteriaceae bacterium]MDY5712602.1 UDP-glucose--hexose-1-phosphate uridylyltransferase [Fusobacterium gastrosuis]